nr:unnamed protein product [Callosobruchus chinensis]
MGQFALCQGKVAHSQVGCGVISWLDINFSINDASHINMKSVRNKLIHFSEIVINPRSGNSANTVCATS